MASLGLSFPICRIWVVFVCYNHCNKTPPTRWLQPAGNPTLPVLQTDPGVSRASERLGRLLPRLLLASGHGHSSWPVLTCDCIPPASASVTTWCPPPVSRFSASSPFLHGYRLYWWIKAHLPPILVAHMAENLLAMQETWVGKIPWRREWLPTPAGPGEFDGQRHLEGYSPWSRRVGHD